MVRVLLLASLLFAHLLGAQELAHSRRITAENDWFDFWIKPYQRPDDNYTQGLRVTWDRDSAPPFMRRVVCRDLRALCGFEAEIGQEIYTPTIDNVTPVPGQRPYAGWLYASFKTTATMANTRRSVTGTAGLTGPISMASAFQEAAHSLRPDFRQPKGWEHQLPTEPPDWSLRLDYERYLETPHSRWLDMVADDYAILGTLRTSGGVRMHGRFGAGLNHPWLVDPHPSESSIYVIFGGRAEAVARDLFLDGLTFGHSQHVRKYPFVFDAERGIGLRLNRVELEYTAVNRTREYENGPANHPYGRIALNLLAK